MSILIKCSPCVERMESESKSYIDNSVLLVNTIQMGAGEGSGPYTLHFVHKKEKKETPQKPAFPLTFT